MMVLLAYRHGFRVSELVRLQWQDIDWERGLIHCRRVKNGTGCASLMVETSRTSSGEGIVEKIANLRQKIEK